MTATATLSNGNGKMADALDAHRAGLAIPALIVKRDGRVVPFEIGRIEVAMERCFASFGRTPETPIEELAQRVVNIMAAKSNGASPTVELAAPGSGSLVIASFGTITDRQIGSGAETVLYDTGLANSFVLDPAVSPDGSTIAFINMPPAEIINGRFDAGSNLWVMDRDGSNPRLVWEHIDPNQLVRFPSSFETR